MSEFEPYEKQRLLEENQELREKLERAMNVVGNVWRKPADVRARFTVGCIEEVEKLWAWWVSEGRKKTVK